MTEKLREELIYRLGEKEALSDNEILEQIDELIVLKSRQMLMPLSMREKLRKELFASVRGMDVLQELLDNADITEIMINGYKDIFVEEGGRLRKSDKSFVSKERLEDVIQQMVATANRRVNEAEPIVDSRLPDGSRINVILAPIAINGPVVTIRKFPETPVTMEQLIGWGSITAEVADFLKDLVAAGYNIFVCGGTGSGKTTFLNALSNYIPADERVITIEDSAELQLKNIANLVSLETRNANAEGENGITIRDLIKTALRSRPDRIIVGEIRGKEALDLLQAFNTGHDGSLSTGHANSPADMLSRIETMVLMGMDMPIEAVRSQIGSALDIIVYLGRLRDKSRRVLSVVEIDGYNAGEVKCHDIFKFCETGEENGKIIGTLKGSRKKLRNRMKLEMAGIYWGDNEEN